MWNEIARDYDKVSRNSRAHLDKFQKVADMVMDLNPDKVLDLGCGSGILEEILTDRGFGGSVEGLDISEEMLKIAQNKNKNPKINYRLFDLNNKLPFPDESFDCVVAINSMIFVKDQKLFLSESNRILKNRKFFYLVNPKPIGEVKSFLIEQYRGLSVLEKIKESIKLILNLTSVSRIAGWQKKLDRRSSNILFLPYESEYTKKLVFEGGFKLLGFEEIQAKQNWLYKLEKA